MTIQSQTDWWALAHVALPAMRDYALEFDCAFNEDAANEELTRQEHAKLWARFQQLWSDLPDHPSIRIYPFGPLCDLCSEYWVFDPAAADKNAIRSAIELHGKKL